MQNKYVGDLGDYGKYALVKKIASTEYKVGVNWYLMDDEENNDGKHIRYLCKKQYRECDPIIFDYLRDIVFENKRSVESVEVGGILGDNVSFYSQPIIIPKNVRVTEKRAFRKKWHERAFEKLRDCDIVFLDPDNGLEVKSVSPYSAGKKNGGKYVAISELAEYYNSGKSVIVYNHRDRSKKQDYYSKFLKICEEENICIRNVFIMNYKRGTSRDYIFFAQEKHRENLMDACKELVKTNWKKHFELICLSSIN